MSLAFLMYNKRNDFVSTMDLVNIMNIGNELYSGLSSLSRQSYLLLTEVPEMIIVFNINYQLQYSPSYTGNIHGKCEGVRSFRYKSKSIRLTCKVDSMQTEVVSIQK